VRPVALRGRRQRPIELRLIKAVTEAPTREAAKAALLMETNQYWMGRIYLSMEEEPEAVTEALAECCRLAPVSPLSRVSFHIVGCLQSRRVYKTLHTPYKTLQPR
jgi:hypothetical protein